MSANGKYLIATRADDKDYLYISSDYGQTWTQRDSIRFWYWAAISSDGKYMVAGVDPVEVPDGFIYMSADYGETWTPRF
ncbi:MAG TPA: hypothetical protein VHY08_24005 [Bacillota bacterium]|nr:hypothetical protein [Bacillota bacterium]